MVGLPQSVNWKEPALGTIVTHLFGLWIIYKVLLALYNISPLHPLARFPGPRLAAATFMYEAWFDLILGGRYTHEIKRLHGIYGPVVRINPEELHFNDIKFADEIYASGGRKRDKPAHYTNFSAGPMSVVSFSTREHNLHRVRRGALNKFFSKGQISKLEPSVKRLAENLCDKMIRLGDKPFDLAVAYSCFTSDVVSDICFGEAFGFVAQDLWEPNFKVALSAILDPIYVIRFISPIRLIFNLAPSLGTILDKNFRYLMKECGERVPNRIRKAYEDQRLGIKRDKSSLFASMLDSSLPNSEKTLPRLAAEGLSMLAAGTETTAWALSLITFHLLSQPETLARLTTELNQADALNMSWFELEKLPYLNAVVSEAIRHGFGVSQRSPRLAPDETLIYRGHFKGHNFEYIIPPGTPVGMTTAITNMDENVFPEPKDFVPERWLGLEDSERHKLANHVTSFSKGSRQCVGINLAYCKIYLAIVIMTLRVIPRMRLYETTIKDVMYDCDYFVPRPVRSSKGVRVTVS